MQLRLDIEEFWSLLNHDNHYAYCPIMGLFGSVTTNILGCKVHYLYTPKGNHGLIGVYRVKHCLPKWLLISCSVIPLSQFDGYHLG